MKKDNIDNLLAMTMSLGKIYDASYTDDFCFFNEKLLGYSVNLAIEIDELLEEEYTKEEIISFIINGDFKMCDPTLTKDDEEYLKRKTLNLVDIRYKLYIEKSENNHTRNLEKSSN